MEQFWESGFEATGLADLEACTGLGRQSLYTAFGDKRAMFVACLERYRESDIAAIRASELESSFGVVAGLDYPLARDMDGIYSPLQAFLLQELGRQVPEDIRLARAWNAF